MAILGKKISGLRLIWFLAAGCLALPSAAGAEPVAGPQTACSSGELTCLSKGWTEPQRSWWYTTSQGSRLLPLSWALALKTEDGSSAFFGTDHLESLGYLANPVSSDNPNGLPVGFVVDHQPHRDADLMCDRFPETCKSRTMREPWVGLNCSACHTAEVTFQGTRFRVDGAPTMANFDALVSGAEASLRATLADDERYGLFAGQVLGGSRDPQQLNSLKNQIREQLTWMELLNEINHGAIEAGPARLDAQGHILTKVALVNGSSNPSREFSSDAPASYPFIWNTHQQDKLQWNGIAPELLDFRIMGRTTNVGALVRNVSEVIGVFAHIEANRGWAGLGYDSSVRVTELVGLERVLAQLQSPEWPADILGPLDDTLRTEGRALFETKCRNCHAHLDPGDLNTPAGDKMVNLIASGTDVFLACNTYLRRTDAGNMAGQGSFGFFGDRIGQDDTIHKMLVNAAAGVIFGKLDEVAEALFTDVGPRDIAVATETPVGEILPGVADPLKKAQATECLTTSDALLAYKSRPLNGIWATAPYLHNGSVPTLYDLLLPPKARNIASRQPVPTGETRPETFGVGSREFDPVKVGFVSEDAPWTFRVRDEAGNIIPGNSNAGHDYGNASLTDDQRRALVEYLKGL